MDVEAGFRIAAQLCEIVITQPISKTEQNRAYK